VAATSTGVITLCRVGSSRVARAAEWSRVPWGGESRGSGGEDEPCSVIRFNYNLLWICLNHSIAAVFYAANSNYSFSWNCSGGKNCLLAAAFCNNRNYPAVAKSIASQDCEARGSFISGS
jgi:hypothetical protein